MINFIDNIIFQKKYFPEMVDNYIIPENGKKKGALQVKENTFMYFYMSDESSLMTHINNCFGVNLVFDLPASTAYISFGYENKILGFDEGIVKISINHPFLNIGYSVVFSHELENSILEKSCDVYSFFKIPLKQIKELQIRRYYPNYYFETHNISSYDEILDIIEMNRPEYVFRYETVPNEKKMRLMDAEFCDKYSLLIISTINDSWHKKEDEIIKECVNVVMENFRIRGVEVVGKYLQIGEFNTNFVAVEKYFQFEQKCKQELSSHLKDSILVLIRNCKKNNNRYTTLHNIISSDENILNVDNYLCEKVGELNDILEEV